jgi:hypothetical protein
MLRPRPGPCARRGALRAPAGGLSGPAPAPRPCAGQRGRRLLASAASQEFSQQPVIAVDASAHSRPKQPGPPSLPLLALGVASVAAVAVAGFKRWRSGRCAPPRARAAAAPARRMLRAALPGAPAGPRPRPRGREPDAGPSVPPPLQVGGIRRPLRARCAAARGAGRGARRRAGPPADGRGAARLPQALVAPWARAPACAAPVHPCTRALTPAAPLLPPMHRGAAQRQHGAGGGAQRGGHRDGARAPQPREVRLGRGSRGKGARGPAARRLRSSRPRSLPGARPPLRRPRALASAPAAPSAYLKMDLEEVELPDNHPWAVKKPVRTREGLGALAAAGCSGRCGMRRGRQRHTGQSVRGVPVNDSAPPPLEPPPGDRAAGGGDRSAAAGAARRAAAASRRRRAGWRGAARPGLMARRACRAAAAAPGRVAPRPPQNVHPAGSGDPTAAPARRAARTPPPPHRPRAMATGALKR